MARHRAALRTERTVGMGMDIAQADLAIKPTQLQNMDKVYQSAYVTIIAAGGHTPEFGLTGVSTRSRKHNSLSTPMADG